VNGLALNSPSFLNLTFQYWLTNPTLADVDARNLYGTNANSPSPYGRTYTHPAVIPAGVDSHGEIIQLTAAASCPVLLLPWIPT
jgi:hypothetical protein